ncbi:MAG TPA: hypothetical protein PKD88_06230 [Nitrosomonas sp.]|nr:hypothetical protein [Nitrosomonas sp.]HMW20587.1 hypothetical protein [Nitrosomonas sp.]HMW68864.1 hypothetical protein [Nitrosomonas sp.]HMY62331.1 hypothetical protein [Nitrosomonas sp.]HMY90124.1 hypothetical protein [Nitrosomonas sp.]
MTDHLDVPPEPEDNTLLNKLDAILKKYRKEYSAVIRPADLKATPAIPEPPTPIVTPAPTQNQSDVLPSFTVPEIPILTERIVVAPEISFNESGISLLLCYAFDSALKDAKLDLTSTQRFELLQALAQRLPKNL